MTMLACFMQARNREGEAMFASHTIKSFVEARSTCRHYALRRESLMGQDFIDIFSIEQECKEWQVTVLETPVECRSKCTAIFAFLIRRTT